MRAAGDKGEEVEGRAAPAYFKTSTCFPNVHYRSLFSFPRAASAAPHSLRTRESVKGEGGNVFTEPRVPGDEPLIAHRTSAPPPPLRCFVRLFPVEGWGGGVSCLWFVCALTDWLPLSRDAHLFVCMNCLAGWLWLACCVSLPLSPSLSLSYVISRPVFSCVYFKVAGLRSLLVVVRLVLVGQSGVLCVW